GAPIGSAHRAVVAARHHRGIGSYGLQHYFPAVGHLWPGISSRFDSGILRLSSNAGGGKLRGGKYLYDVAPRDGTVFGSLAQTLALDSMTNTKAKLDMANMPYIGRVVTNIETGAA